MLYVEAPSMTENNSCQMLKVLRAIHGHLSQTHKSQFGSSNYTRITVSYLDNSNETLVPDLGQEFELNEAEEVPSTKSSEQEDPFARENAKRFGQSSSTKTCEVRISHPWPEWVELMEQLLKNGFFEGVGNPFQKRELDAKHANRIRTACLNFARDRFDLMRYFSRKHIQVIAGSGCPVTDRKVVNSGKRLRAHVGVDEENVCSSCYLRGNCERAYAKARGGEAAETVDVMRYLLTYGLDPVTGVVENKPCLNKSVMESVRKLLKEIIEHSMKELSSDPPVVKFTKWHSSMHDSIHQRRLRTLQEDQDHRVLKKGDWICNKCNFLNFANKTRCLQCNEKPSKRQLNPGEWECNSCNYINFRRNARCKKCDHRRLKVSYRNDSCLQPQHDN
ncbi:zinc finger protein VAR3, chloroplastic-like [Diospyros lotus]|uniref:zinc finger protein VAR3, chloroplastic-like n=1 Tax=Diospyros lotus TaxID=55363 RepID=UPI00224E5E9D|nr:zinc finger protein VAR3, chloroplastic-like [Diospyros lotus]